jgi:hypothetical protein
MSASKPGAKEIAERIRKERFLSERATAHIGRIISSALEARERDVQELCRYAGYVATWFEVKWNEKQE